MQQSIATIVAPATAPGRAGVAVIRLSGPRSSEIVFKLAPKKLQPRVATYANILSRDGSLLDNVLLIFFPGPHSYTGEDICEIHCHGSPIVVDLIIAETIALGATFAGPGEFTQRAFLNGKLDLYQAESVAALIDANSAQAVKSASRSLAGHFSSKVSDFQKEMTALRVYIEASLDFVEEEIDFLSNSEVEGRLDNLLNSLSNLRSTMEVGRLVTEGAKVVLTGPTNAGKSSLFNQLSGADDAIVTPESGTTRDSLKQQVKVGDIGVTVDLIDTAGIREASGAVEQEGISRSKRHLRNSDITILLLSADTYKEGDFDRFLKKELNFSGLGGKIVFVINKVDLNPNMVSKEISNSSSGCYISAKTSEGITDLQNIICNIVLSPDNSSEPIFIARRRHLVSLDRTLQCIKDAKAELSARGGFEIIAEQLRLAQQSLGEITGTVSTEDLLGEIFGSFCIGK